jgi:uncharacterized membrane protein YeaQ/YmgE (transglycosylase-associated protein family)
MPWIVQIIVIGFVVGIITRLLMPKPFKPKGLALTTVLGIVGAYVATQVGRAFGWVEPGELAGAIEMIVGAAFVTLIWNTVVIYRTKHGTPNA